MAHLGLRKIIIERRNVPEIMTTGLITPAEVDKLFDIFFKKMNVSGRDQGRCLRLNMV